MPAQVHSEPSREFLPLQRLMASSDRTVQLSTTVQESLYPYTKEHLVRKKYNLKGKCAFSVTSSAENIQLDQFRGWLYSIR